MSDTYTLEFVPFEVTKASSTYGSGTYGGSTYGQEGSDPLSNIQYVAAPSPGEWSISPAWEFRIGDVGQRFEAYMLGLDGAMDLTPIVEAELILERMSIGPQLTEVYELVVDDTNDVVYREWVAGDLTTPGLFRVLIRLTSSTTRKMTVDTTDEATLIVRHGGS